MPIETLADELRVARQQAAVALRPEVRTLVLSGPDRVRFLNGMVTADVAALTNGTGTFAVKTNNKGRVEGCLRVRASNELLWMEVLDVVAEPVLRALSRYIIMDDCAVADASADRDVLCILGPQGGEALKTLGFSAEDLALPDHGWLRRKDRLLIRDRSVGPRGYELHVPAGAGEPALALLNLPRLSPAGLEVLRIESGVPFDGRDLDDTTFPMEARLEIAVSAAKGCYIGQEVIARAILQGHMNYLLVGLSFGGGLPPADAPLFDATGKKAGDITSVANSPELGGIGLGYVRRALETPGTTLWARPEGSAELPTTVVALPFIAV